MDSFTSLITTPPSESVEPTSIDSERLSLAEMVAIGKSTADIADSLGHTVNWVRQHKKDTDVQAVVQTLQMECVEQAKSVIINGTTKATEAILQIIESGPPKERLKASQDLLDRIGLRAPEKREVSQTVTYHVPREERLSQIMARAERLGLKIGGGTEGDVIDVE